MKYIDGYENRYSVDITGKVWSHLSDKWLKQLLTPSGYCTVTLYREGSTTRHPVLVHRLVANAFIKNIDNKPEVNHINFITTDNRIENLEWVTPLENISHSIKHGRHKGETRFKKGNDRWKNTIHPFSKSVIEKNSGRTFNSIKEAAREFNLPHQYVSTCIKKSGITQGLKFRLERGGV